MRRLLLALAVALGHLPAALTAQVRRDPGVMIDNKIVVRVYVQLGDEGPPYFPLPPVEVRFYRGARDSVVAQTDGAGALTTLLAPGEWRLASMNPVLGTRRSYRWSLPITVREWMTPVELTALNATSPMSRTSAGSLRGDSTTAARAKDSTAARRGRPPR